MTIGEKIKKHRKAMKMTQTELGERLGVQKNAVSKWETGRVEDIPTGKIRQMAEMFDVPVAYLMQDELETPAFSSEHDRLAELFDLLNKAGRRQLMTFARYLSSQPEMCSAPPKGEITYIRHYLFPAAAGYASPIEGEEYVLEPRTGDTPEAADFAVTISGDSMEPYIRDGDTVYVQRDATLQEFDVGVFYVDGDVLCKQFCLDAYRNLHLLSANPAREDANRVISADSGGQAVCYGKVLLDRRLPKPSYL